jgi:segregation and condensation protein A
VGNLELDLDVFAGPFDLLLSLVLRDELDLLEVDLADIVITYVDHLERCGELDLESTTEFLVLIAALLELKSRMMLPGDDEAEFDELLPGEAAEELLARMLAYARYRGGASWMRERFEAFGGVLFRSAPLPAELRRVSEANLEAVFAPDRLGAALGDLLRHPAPLDLRHIRTPTVTLQSRLNVLRDLLRRGSFSFEDAVRGADTPTICVTLWALLELYKRGEASWEQDESFGEVRVVVSDVPGFAGAEEVVA